MDAPDASAGDRGGTPTFSDWLRPRVRIVGSALGVGLLLGAVATAVYAVVESPAAAERSVFALGALALGFGTLGWSGSVMAGRGIEAMQAHLDTGGGWTERDSRRAMVRVAAFGLGLMGGASVVAPLV